MAQGLRTKPANFNVVFHQAERLAEAIDLRREVLLLMVEAGTPRENASDVQPFAHHLQEHVLAG